MRVCHTCQPRLGQRNKQTCRHLRLGQDLPSRDVAVALQDSRWPTANMSKATKTTAAEESPPAYSIVPSMAIPPCLHQQAHDAQRRTQLKDKSFTLLRARLSADRSTQPSTLPLNPSHWLEQIPEVSMSFGSSTYAHFLIQLDGASLLLCFVSFHIWRKEETNTSRSRRHWDLDLIGRHHWRDRMGRGLQCKA